MCGEEPYVLPELELSLHDVDSTSREFEHERLATLNALATKSAGITLAPAYALLQRTSSPEELTGK
jgi:transcription-repair coupling factor (superfamily II helicase)